MTYFKHYFKYSLANEFSKLTNLHFNMNFKNCLLKFLNY